MAISANKIEIPLMNKLSIIMIKYLKSLKTTIIYLYTVNPIISKDLNNFLNNFIINTFILILFIIYNNSLFF